MKERVADPSQATGCVAVVAARFNAFVVDAMVDGALETLHRHGIPDADIDLSRVPGAYELPVAAEALASTGKYRAVIALGAVIRGETPHFDFVAGECARGLDDVALRHRLPVAFGVITCDDVEQARARAGGKVGNKGEEATLAALEMMAWFDGLGGYGS